MQCFCKNNNAQVSNERLKEVYLLHLWKWRETFWYTQAVRNLLVALGDRIVEGSFSFAIHFPQPHQFWSYKSGEKPFSRNSLPTTTCSHTKTM